MCKKRNSVVGIVFVDDELKHIRVDSCIRHLPYVLSNSGFDVVASCCGHGKYPLTIICKNKRRTKNNHYDLISGKDIPRTRNFYRLDSEGFYYIPEVVI